MDGLGVYKYANGSVYDGNWKDNKFNGRGKLTHPSGKQYDGYFKDGLPEGQGWYRDKDGHV